MSEIEDRINIQELQYAINKIDYWYRKDTKFLTIVTVPFNTSCIFVNVIEKIVKNKGKILYVWGKSKENRELIEYLNRLDINVSYSYTDNKDGNASLNFIHHNNLQRIKDKYDLIIFDDITYFSNISNLNIRKKIELCEKLSDKILLYGIEKNFFIGEKVELAQYNYKKPFLEPRLITTRIDLNKDIPYSLYDYLKWFKENKDKVIICVPDKDKLENIYEYFINKLKFSNVKILKVDNKDQIRKVEKVLKNKDKAIFILTDKMEEVLEDCYMDNAILLFSEDNYFNYKKILYLCGKIGVIRSELSEILLVSNNISEDMEKAKNMARNFNKKVWEKQLRQL